MLANNNQQSPQIQPNVNNKNQLAQKKGSNKYYIIAIVVVVIIIFSLLTYIIIYGNSDEIIEVLEVDNGEIIDYKIRNGQGYIVLHLEGSYYEMGYAHAKLIGDYIVKGVKEIKSILGSDYGYYRGIVENSVWGSSEIEDELDGMVDSLAITHPSDNIDKLDLKIVNSMGDWYYSYACRSHSCWGRYVSDPVKTISTRRLDFPAPITSLKLHVLCAREPNDGSPQWVNLGWPGSVTSATGVNEYGTLASIHDYGYMNTDLSAGTLPRMAACRYALTYVDNSDSSTHLSSVYTELQKYETMTNSYLNYYVPEGYGGVMTCYTTESGPDFYDLRVPSYLWHNGEAIITTNAQTDGTYTPYDEDFGADTYYADETPKTLESHWNLVAKSNINTKLHVFSVEYRDNRDMTIWADGQLEMSSRTKRLEYEWSELFG